MRSSHIVIFNDQLFVAMIPGIRPPVLPPTSGVVPPFPGAAMLQPPVGVAAPGGLQPAATNEGGAATQQTIPAATPPGVSTSSSST